MNGELEKCFLKVAIQRENATFRDLNEQVETLNNIIEKFVYKFLYDENGVFRDERVKCLKQILALYSNTDTVVEPYKYKKQYSPDESMKYAKEFLNELGSPYIDCLEQCEKDNTIIFCTKEVAKQLGLEDYSTCYYYDGKNYISIVVSFRVYDILSIIHETVHATNNYKDEINDFEPADLNDKKFYTWDLFTETMSCLATHLAQQYYAEKYPYKKELQVNSAEEGGHYYTYLECDFMLNALDLYLSNSQITVDDVYDLVYGEDENYIDASSIILEDFAQRGYFNIIQELSYLLAHVITEYIVNNYSYEESMNILKEMNSMITYDKVVNIFKYLDLDAEELDKWFIKIEDSELEKLGDKHVKKIK